MEDKLIVIFTASVCMLMLLAGTAVYLYGKIFGNEDNNHSL